MMTSNAERMGLLKALVAMREIVDTPQGPERWAKIEELAKSKDAMQAIAACFDKVEARGLHID